MRKIIAILCLSMVVGQLAAQLSNTAENQFNDNNYSEALLSYEKLLKQSPKATLYLYRYARCAQELGDYTTAIE